jgi:hypothetical protein
MAGAAHYSGVRVDSSCPRPRRRSTGVSLSLESHADLKEEHARVLKDLTELFSGRPTLEIFDRSWSKDAVFRVDSLFFLADQNRSHLKRRTHSQVVRVMMNMFPRYATCVREFCQLSDNSSVVCDGPWPLLSLMISVAQSLT